jgi:hypothetical protein
LGLKPGDTLTIQFMNGEESTVTTAGLTADPGTTAGLRHLRLQSGVVSHNAVPASVEPTFSLFALAVEEDKLAPCLP